MCNRSLFYKAMTVALLSVCMSGSLTPSHAAAASDLIGQYIEQLRDINAEHSFDAGRNLAKMADPAATDALIVVLKTDKDPWIRTRAAQALGERGDKRAVDALIEALRDKDIGVRQWVAESLEAFKDPKAIPALISILADDDLHVGSPKVIGALTSYGVVALKPLYAATKDDDPKVRLNAVTAVSIILYRDKDASAFDPLLSALKDTNADVRDAAADALGALKDPRAVDPIIAALSAGRISSGTAAFALGNLGGEKSVNALLGLLRDEDDETVKRAAEALGGIGDRKAGDALFALRANNNPEVRATVGVALAQLGDSRAAPILVKALVIGCGEEIRVALTALGPDAVDTLGAALKDIKQFTIPNPEEELSAEERQTSDNTRRFWIVEILGDIKDPRAEAALIGALPTSSQETKAIITYVLRNYRSDHSVDALISMLGDKSENVRDAAISSLKEIGDPRGTKAVLALVAKDPKSLTDSVVDFLASADVPQAGELVLPMLKDQDAKARMRAVSICMKLGDRRMAKHLVPLMSDSNPSVRQVTAVALGALGDPASAPSLITALKDVKPTVRQYASESLGQLRDPKSVQPLVSALKDPIPNVRAAAAKALGEFKDPSTVAPLIALMKENDWDRRMELLAQFCASLEGSGLHMDHARENAAAALGKMGKPAVSPLVACLKDPDPMTRQLALAALGQIGDTEPIDAIAALLKTRQPPEKYPVAEAAWNKIIERISKQEKDPRAVKGMNEMRKRLEESENDAGDGGIRLAAAESLGNMKDPRAVTLLLQLVGDASRSVRAQAIESLSAQNDPSALDVYVSALRDPDERVRQSAGEALMEAKDPRAVDVLIAVGKSKTADAQRYVIDGLSRHKTPEATEAIASLLSDDSSYESHHGEATRVSEAAAIALTERNDPRGIPILLDMLHVQNPDSYYRTLAARTLTRLTSLKDPSILVRAHNETNPAVKLMAAAMLARIGRPEGSDALSLAKAAMVAPSGHTQITQEQEGSTDLNQSEIALYALSVLESPEAGDLLISALNNSNAAIRATAVEALGDRREKRAVAPLISMLKNSGDERDSVWDIAEALGKIGDRRAVDALIPLLSMQMSPDLAEKIPAALTAITGQNFGADPKSWRDWWLSQKK